MIDWAQFTPWPSLLGGALIGLAAALLLLFNGRIAGISGIIGGLLKPNKHDMSWRVAFLLGLIASPFIWTLLAPLPVIQINTSTPLIIVAGLLVGFGTRLGSGCTSGHGVCGIARLSPRSIVATLAFMFTGILTVYVIRHLLTI